MLGILIDDIEQKEMEYLIKRELDELLFDMEDNRLDKMVRIAISDRYKVLFQLFRRVANQQEVIKYMPKNIKWSK